ncbi:MAG TPA: PqqD family peptide modification chaperone, partial [Blastocatellia bacterium]|nr:PqqD family peptide modification chaperone [Blastocatellia bacterium]
MADAKPITSPRARRDALVIRRLPEEVLIYDLQRHKAHCLNGSAAIIWNHCDGKTTMKQMAA